MTVPGRIAGIVPAPQVYDRPLSERPRLVKLGVKSGQRISLIGLDEPGFTEELVRAGADVSRRLRRDSDLVFFAARAVADLRRLADLRRYIKSNGAVWVVRRKGPDAAIKEVQLIEAGLAARMVDNKIVAFDERLSAMRLVIRLVDR
jgi:hypothetical protein